ncbi:MAG TPA: TonB-dependent receptor plug domain-containing protein, partial [Sphingomicrobium sp.]|nr:TonB-dependent receptor plug domain-containing protein [Sphingomicrobium sp.]
MTRTAIAFAGTASLGVLAATPVAAQQVSQTPAGSSVSGIGQLQEVLVTARRREERLQSVPIAITAYSGEQLRTRNIDSQSDLAINTPSLVNNASGFPSELGGSQSFAIRGQGPAYGAVPGTVVYFADVPDLSFAGIDGRRGTYFDMQSVQVLKGPQGTLFGKNATGGNVLFQPQKPVDDFDGYAQIQLGDFRDRAFEGALNVPIVRDRVLFRIAGSAERRAGYTTDVGPYFSGKDYDNVDYETVRASLVVRPTDDIESYTILRYYREDDHGPGTVLIAFNPNASQGPFTVGNYFPNWALLLAQQQARGPRQVSYNLDEFVTSRNWQAINTTSWEAGDWLTIKNIASYASDRTRYGYDYDATPDPIAGQLTTNGWTNAIDSWTEELQFQGKVLNRALDYTAGVYGDKFYPGENQTFEADYFPVSTVLLGGQLLPVLADNQQARSRAAYAQGTYDFSGLAPFLKGLSATAGYRFTSDD